MSVAGREEEEDDEREEVFEAEIKEEETFGREYELDECGVHDSSTRYKVSIHSVELGE